MSPCVGETHKLYFNSHKINTIQVRHSDCKSMHMCAKENDISMMKIKQHFRFLCFFNCDL